MAVSEINPDYDDDEFDFLSPEEIAAIIEAADGPSEPIEQAIPEFNSSDDEV